MTTPASGTISFNDVKTEFGLSNPVSMSDMYSKGGAPAGPTLSMSDMYNRTAFSVSLAPSPLYAGVSSNTITSGVCTATTSGGTAGFTYAWTYLSGDIFTINGPTTIGASFTGTGITLGTQKIGLYRCTVTDSASKTAFANVQVTLEHL